MYVLVVAGAIDRATMVFRGCVFCVFSSYLYFYYGDSPPIFRGETCTTLLFSVCTQELNNFPGVYNDSDWTAVAGYFCPSCAVGAPSSALGCSLIAGVLAVFRESCLVFLP